MRRLRLLAARLPSSLIATILRIQRHLPPHRGRRPDLSRVELIREIDTGLLRDASFVEHTLLPRLGFNYELLDQFPASLYPYCDEGLLHWQYPNQFSKYLVAMSEYPIRSYLEVGVRHGGTFAITVEYLRRLTGLERALGVDLVPNDALRDYCATVDGARFERVSSTSSRFAELLREFGPVDLVLIDANHSEAAVRRDLEAVRDQANVLVLHDVASAACPGVRTVWEEITSGDAGVYDFLEFTDQYPDVLERMGGQTFFGIGVAIRKSFVRAAASAAVEDSDVRTVAHAARLGS